MQTTNDAKNAAIVLAVMDPIRGRSLIRRIEEQGVHVIRVSRRDEARAVLRGGPPVPIVLTDERLPDGDWRDVLQDVVALGVAAEIVVCASGPEQPLKLSFELLDHGAFGLIAEPYDPDQLQWLINTATSRSKTLPRPRHEWSGQPADAIDQAVSVPPQPVGSV